LCVTVVLNSRLWLKSTNGYMIGQPLRSLFLKARDGSAKTSRWDMDFYYEFNTTLQNASTN